ncbi:glycosyltransferase family 4 protein [Larsenimonas suaedae]|uniref:Glycosyltransferase family 1 protein n=1 Tax=Larsenimonas suaedae TaxID=1851019 RepID=A0ABU1GX58_9GAMM|nr:glycosyltransferase family 1 protein [Larsenimonas suaedae]MCM2971209.1 glycosyltransferase family 1 protein [Larsenimonas suaedae]MDR5895918.1 glycosyltransferase family 1 protein [Larsenimonas suaedae]
MHIADVTMFYAPSSGGVRTYIDAKRRRLPQPGQTRHSVFIPGTEHREIDTHLYTVPAPPLPFSTGYRFPLRRHHWCQALERHRPDIIEAGDPYVTGWAVRDSARRLDVPVVGFYHSDLPVLLGKRFGTSVERLTQRYVKRLYGHYQRVLAPSALMANKLEQAGVRHVSVQPLGVDLTTFRPELDDSARVKRELGLDDETRLLMFAGRGSPEKNMPILLETARQLGDGYHLLLVGSNLPTQLPENVSCTDHFCTPDEVARYMASSDALLHAGTQETFGLIVLEAMACGTPVVAVRAGALPENVPETCGRLCRPDDPAAMADAVRSLFESDQDVLSRHARQFVERRHDWDIIVERLRGHYQELLTGAPASELEIEHG